ncbi:MAG: hypothetical protein R3A48_16385 [Polyangiales bacterium]
MRALSLSLSFSLALLASSAAARLAPTRRAPRRPRRPRAVARPRRRAPRRPRRPRAPRRRAAPSRSTPREESGDLLQSATQVLNRALQGDRPEPAPQRERDRPDPRRTDELLREAGLDPTRLPGALGSLVRAEPERAGRLSPAQLRQLGRIARGRGSLAQLRSVTDAFLRADGDDAAEGDEARPVLSSRELSRVVSRAARGAEPASLGRYVSSLLASE